MNPASQNVSVQSIPSGANVRVNTAAGGLGGQTPWVFAASRQQGCTVIVSKAGYRPLVIQVKVDPASRGGKLVPNPIVVQLASFKSGGSSVLVSPQEGADAMAELPVEPVRKTTTPVLEKRSQPVRGKVDPNGTEYL